jgi:hypothetical protein
MSRYILFLTILFLVVGCAQQQQAFQVTPSTATQIDTLPGSCPNLTKDNKGGVVLSWVRSLNDSSFVFCYARSEDGGKTFSAPVTVPASTTVKPHSENLPKVVFKPSGEIIALWGAASRSQKNKYAGSVYYAQSFDEGRTWSAARPLVTDTAGCDQRYFDVALLPSGEVAIVWLDNRKDTEHEGSSLYFAATSGREGFAGERRVAQQCCQCCRTDLFVDRTGGIHVLYRGILKDSIRDMVHTVSADGGRSFTVPRQISPDNWVIQGCPHTGPAMTENAQGLHFAWYTGGQKKGSFYTSSANNGKSFAPSDSVSYLGKHPQLATLSDGELVIVWDEVVTRDHQFFTRIGMQKRSADGRTLGTTVLTDEALNATYPVLTPVGSQESLVAYCQERDKKKYVTFQRVAFN